jgi:phosphoserine phosphatase
MPELIRSLQQSHISVWVVSGALRAAILPTARFLEIPEHQVLAIEADWNQQGEFIGIRANDPFAIGKVAGCEPYRTRFDKPSVIIGDGMTDYQLYSSGVAQHFIAYCEHASREAVLKLAPLRANNAQELAQHLKQLLS